MIPEVTISIKDEEKTLKKKFLIYEQFTVNPQDPVIHRCIADTLKDFSSEPISIKVRINMKIE